MSDRTHHCRREEKPMESSIVLLATGFAILLLTSEALAVPKGPA